MNRALYEKDKILNFSVQQLIANFQRSQNDSGSPEVQIAIMNRKIVVMSKHLQSKKKDKNSKRHLHMVIGARNKQLKYLRSKSLERYNTLINTLAIKDRL